MYSTERHPFGLVYEYMNNLDLKQYLTNEPEVEKLKLVAILSYVIPVLDVAPSDSSWQQLADIAQGLKRMHELGVAHGDLRTVGHPPSHFFHDSRTLLVLDKHTARQRWHSPHSWPRQCHHSSMLYLLRGYG